MVGCANDFHGYDDQILKKISSIREEQKEVVTVGEVFDFKWDKVYIFKPYTTKDTVKECLKQKIPQYKESVSDSDVQMYFLENERIVYCINGICDTLEFCWDYNFNGEYISLERADSMEVQYIDEIVKFSPY